MKVASLRSSANEASPSTSSAVMPASATAARTASTASWYSLVPVMPPHLAYRVSPTPTRQAARPPALTGPGGPAVGHCGPDLVGVLAEQRRPARR